MRISIKRDISNFLQITW